MFCSTWIFISNKLQLTWSSSIQKIVFITVIKIIFFPIFLFVFPTLCMGNNRTKINTFNIIHLQLETDLREINETYHFLWLLKSTINLSDWSKYKVVHYHERTVLGGQQHPAFDMPPLHTPILLPSSFLW